MKIAFLGMHRPQLSGGILTVLLLVEGLQRLGHQARVLADHEKPDWTPVDVDWRTDGAPLDLLDDDEVVVTGLPGVRAALRSKAPVVGHLCVGYEPHLWPAARERLERVYKLPTVKLVVAPHLQRTLWSELGVDAKLIGQPIALEWFRRPRRTHGDGPPRVLTVGPEPTGPLAPVPFKGIAKVLEVVARTRATGAELSLVRLVPIEDPLLGAVEVDELHVGLRPRAVPDLMSSCEIYLSGSTDAEGFGMPAAEAATAGLAGVLPAIPSYRDIDGLQHAALFYPPGDVGEAVHALRRLLADRVLRAELAAAGPELNFVDRFDPLRVAQRLAAALATTA